MYNNILINLNFLQLIYDRYLSQYELFYQNQLSIFNYFIAYLIMSLTITNDEDFL